MEKDTVEDWIHRFNEKITTEPVLVSKLLLLSSDLNKNKKGTFVSSYYSVLPSDVLPSVDGSVVGSSAVVPPSPVSVVGSSAGAGSLVEVVGAVSVVAVGAGSVVGAVVVSAAVVGSCSAVVSVGVAVDKSTSTAWGFDADEHSVMMNVKATMMTTL